MMQSATCPYCALPIEIESSASKVICPSCFHQLSAPRSTQWTMLIVPFLALQQIAAQVF